MPERSIKNHWIPLIISILSLLVSVACLLLTIVVLVSSANLRGLYAAQIEHENVRDEEIMTFEAYINSLRLIMARAGLDVPEMPLRTTQDRGSTANRKQKQQ